MPPGVAADRGILAAEWAEDPLVVAAGARILAYAVLGAGHFAKAKELTISAAAVLEPGLGRASPSHLSLYGRCYSRAPWPPPTKATQSPAERC
jgi:hypothetical protein